MIKQKPILAYSGGWISASKGQKTLACGLVQSLNKCFISSSLSSYVIWCWLKAQVCFSFIPSLWSLLEEILKKGIF